MLNKIIILFLVFFSLTGKMNVNAQSASGNVEIDSIFTKMFQRDCCGITGADGIYSVLLPNGKTLWIFGDSFLGSVKENGSRDIIDPVFIRNSVALQDGFDLETFHSKINGRDASFLIPPDAPVGKVYSEDSLWFWPGDAYVQSNELEIFLSSFYQKGEGGWGFQWTGTWVASLDINTLKLKSLDKVNLKTNIEIHWGHAVCDDDDDFIYVYGLGDGKPYVARISRDIQGETEIQDASSWTFFDGKNWTKNIKRIKPMIDFKGGEQFSVFKLKDKFVYLTQGGGFSNQIFSFISSTPYGNWGGPTIVYEVPAFENENIFSYNALAHPQFMEDDKLLISFCVNSFRMEDVFEDADNYRPRFIRVPLGKILGER